MNRAGPREVEESGSNVISREMIRNNEKFNRQSQRERASGFHQTFQNADI